MGRRKATDPPPTLDDVVDAMMAKAHLPPDVAWGDIVRAEAGRQGTWHVWTRAGAHWCFGWSDARGRHVGLAWRQVSSPVTP